MGRVGKVHVPGNLVGLLKALARNFRTATWGLPALQSMPIDATPLEAAAVRLLCSQFVATLHAEDRKTTQRKKKLASTAPDVTPAQQLASLDLDGTEVLDVEFRGRPKPFQPDQLPLDEWAEQLRVFLDSKDFTLVGPIHVFQQACVDGIEWQAGNLDIVEGHFRIGPPFRIVPYYGKLQGFIQCEVRRGLGTPIPCQLAIVEWCHFDMRANQPLLDKTINGSMSTCANTSLVTFCLKPDPVIANDEYPDDGIVAISRIQHQRLCGLPFVKSAVDLTDTDGPKINKTAVVNVSNYIRVVKLTRSKW